MREEFVEALRSNQAAFSVELDDAALNGLADYYEVVQEHNPLLHLVGPCTPAEFAVRHVLESLTLLEYLPRDAKFGDVGAGAGLPSMPCLIVRPDLHAVLIDSKEKKTTFLRAAAERCNLTDRTRLINKQFAEVTRPHISHVACRALDKFAQKLPQLLKWADGRDLLFFGGPALRDELQKLGLKVEEKLMPFSEQRHLFVIKQ